MSTAMLRPRFSMMVDEPSARRPRTKGRRLFGLASAAHPQIAIHNQMEM
jgi:hypothetical protein